MDKIILAIFTFISGFWAKKFFDNRDLRRKVLEPVFLEFEKHVIYLKHKWRENQKDNISNNDHDSYAKEYDFARSELIRFNPKEGLIPRSLLRYRQYEILAT